LTSGPPSTSPLTGADTWADHRGRSEPLRELWRTPPIERSHATTFPYSPEVRERAVVMVAENRHEYESQWAAIVSIASKFGMSPETLRLWVRRAEVDGGDRSGLTTDERKCLKELERENPRETA